MSSRLGWVGVWLLLAAPAWAQSDAPAKTPPPAAAKAAGSKSAAAQPAAAATSTSAAEAPAAAANKPAPAAGSSSEGGSPPASSTSETTTSQSGAATSPPASNTSKPATQGADNSSYNLKLRAIQQRVNELKEKIFESKARLIQLQEVVLHGTISGAKAVLIHRNEMGSSFRLWRVQYALDGSPIFNRVDSGNGDLNSQEEITIFNGSIAPGNHQISVYLVYHGYGYGIFSYLKGYTFKIKSSDTFTAEEGKVTTVRIVGYEKGGITTQLKDRPAVRYDITTAQELRRPQQSVKNAAKTPASTPAAPAASSAGSGSTSSSAAQPGGQ